MIHWEFIDQYEKCISIRTLDMKEQSYKIVENAPEKGSVWVQLKER